MKTATKLHVDLFDVNNRLANMGLSIDIFSDVLRSGYLSFIKCSDLDPPMFPGISMWAAMVRCLRQHLLARDWEYKDDGNFSTVCSPNGEMAIAIATGDSNTGSVGTIPPTTQSPKGPRTINAVTNNSSQLELDFGLAEIGSQMRSGNENVVITWLLLVHRNDTTVYAELSQPMGIDENQRVCGWHERIILPAVDFDPEEAFDFDQDDEIEIDIPVIRKQSDQ